LLIYNAGAESQMVNFLDRSLDGVSAPIRLNVIGTTTLCHHFGTLMRERGRGGIILVGSMAGFAGSALVATYAGSKAFLQVFAESLWFELRPHGIQVLGLILGTTKTPAMERVGLVFDEAVHRPMESDDAAQEGLDHLADGPTWIAGKQNRKFGDILRTSDRRQMVEMMSNVAMTVAPKIRAKSQQP
jgi:short-subunit dehydrogenase